jgi:hypothetical protein
MNLKSEIIKDDIISNNKDWKLFSNHVLKSYIKSKYKASTYIINKVIKELNDSKTESR